MDREAKVTLHRQRNSTGEARMIEEGSAAAMIGHIMDQPRMKRSEYSIMDGETIYEPTEIEAFARQFGLLEEKPADAKDWIAHLA